MVKVHFSEFTIIKFVMVFVSIVVKTKYEKKNHILNRLLL